LHAPASGARRKQAAIDAYLDVLILRLERRQPVPGARLRISH
jgi:hypothetical protein